MNEHPSFGAGCSDPSAHPEKTIRPDGAICISYPKDNGDVEMVSYEIFPGIRLVHNCAHLVNSFQALASNGDYIVIHHCREGRIERQFDGEFFYLGPGDLAVARSAFASKEYGVPLGHYHGISIIIDTASASTCFSYFLKDVNVTPACVADRLCRDGNCFVVRSQKYVEHIFSQLYSVPDSYRKGYFKIKVMELLLVLSGIDPNMSDTRANSLPEAQVTLAKQIAAYLTEHMDVHITSKTLSERFHLSETHLRNIFKAVYGIPVYSYIRIQKMQLAAVRLTHTDQTVLEIANACGYTNASKFASAFRDVMGETPLEYRNAHGLRR